MTPRELAKWLIRPYVKRGDSIDSLRRGGMGYAGRDGEVRIQLDHIIVERVGPWDTGTPCNERFRLKEIYAEVQRDSQPRITQISLFGGAA